MRTMTVRRCGQGTFQFLVEAAAVRQAGERVLHRKLMRAPLGPDAAARLRGVAARESARTAQAVRGREASRARALRPPRRRAPAWAHQADLEDVVFVGDQRGDHHHRQQENALPDRRPSDAMCASRWLSHEIAWDYTTQKRCGRPLGKISGNVREVPINSLFLIGDNGSSRRFPNCRQSFDALPFLAGHRMCVA